jgi:transcriptional regulator with XRE-family HTH domain
MAAPTREQLRQARTLLGLSQRKLAEMLGVSSSLVNEAEAGKRDAGRARARLTALLTHKGIVFHESGEVTQIVPLIPRRSAP